MTLYDLTIAPDANLTVALDSTGALAWETHTPEVAPWIISTHVAVFAQLGGPVPVAVTPEPTTAALLALGAVAAWWARRRAMEAALRRVKAESRYVMDDPHGYYMVAREAMADVNAALADTPPAPEIAAAKEIVEILHEHLDTLPEHERQVQRQAFRRELGAPPPAPEAG